MIGIFDSGVGGLSVVKEIFKTLPQYQVIYFGDTARLPYGTKGADFVKRYSIKITDWLLKNKASVIIIACHTSSAQASDFVKKEFKSIPIFEMIGPAAEEISKRKFKNISIIGTPGTIKSRAWEKRLLKINPKIKIYSKSCPLFVPLIEEGWADKKITKEIVKYYLKDFKKIQALILACTHYPMLKKVIKNNFGKEVEIIDPAKSLAENLKLFLENNPSIESTIKKGNNHKFYFSDEPYNFEKISHFCFNKRIKPIIKDPF